MLTSNDKIGSTIQSSSAYDVNPVADRLNTRISFLAAGMHSIAFAISVVGSLLLLSWVILLCRRGFEFTDEGFYLNWISNPWNYHSSVSQFGFIYHPLYRLVGGDVVLLRQVNILILFGLAWAVCFVLLRSIFGQVASIDHRQSAALSGVALVVGASSLSFLDFWLPTPNYNSLTLQSLMLAAIGALLADRELSKSSLAGWILIGIGGGFAFLAKPTSAAMLGCMMAVYLGLAGKFRLRGLSIAVFVAGLFVVGAALAIDGSLVGFIRRISDGFAQASRLDAGYSVISIFRWDGIAVRGEQKYIFLCILTIAFATASLSLLGNSQARCAAALIALAMSAMVIATITGLPLQKISHEPFQPAQISAVAIGIALAGFVRQLRTRLRLSRSSFAIVVFLVALPYAYAFGTGTNFGAAAARAGLFWFLAGLVVYAGVAAADKAWRQLIPLAAVALLVPAGVISSAMEAPFRQTQPLRLQRNAMDIIPGQSRIFLSEETATYIRRLREIAAANGFRAGDPVLDLTGANPGTLYVMGARPLGTAWTLGGYHGSTDFLAAALDGEPCEAIAVSWILTEPSAPERFSVEMLRQFGIDLAADYVSVGSISSTRSFSPQKFEHRLLKPVRSAEMARLACENARRTRISRLN